jgi:hypothetical protein
MSPHTNKHKQYRRHTVKEHDHRWDSQQDFNELKHVIIFNKLMLTILSTSVAHTRRHTYNICEAFPLKVWSPSDAGHHWPKRVKV